MAGTQHQGCRRRIPQVGGAISQNEGGGARSGTFVQSGQSRADWHRSRCNECHPTARLEDDCRETAKDKANERQKQNGGRSEATATEGTHEERARIRRSAS